MSPFRRVALMFSKITQGEGGRRGQARSEELGQGLWRRAYADCAAALRDDPHAASLLPEVYRLAHEAQRRWPSDSLDVPADPAGREAYGRLQAVRRALREASYRADLVAHGLGGDEQRRRQQAALRDAQALLSPSEG